MIRVVVVLLAIAVVMQGCAISKINEVNRLQGEVIQSLLDAR